MSIATSGGALAEPNAGAEAKVNGVGLAPNGAAVPPADGGAAAAPKLNAAAPKPAAGGDAGAAPAAGAAGELAPKLPLAVAPNPSVGLPKENTGVEAGDFALSVSEVASVATPPPQPRNGKAAFAEAPNEAAASVAASPPPPPNGEASSDVLPNVNAGGEFGAGNDDAAPSTNGCDVEGGGSGGDPSDGAGNEDGGLMVPSHGGRPGERDKKGRKTKGEDAMIRRTHRQHSPAPARTYTYTYLMAANRELAGQGSLTVAHRAAQEAEAQAARVSPRCERSLDPRIPPQPNAARSLQNTPDESPEPLCEYHHYRAAAAPLVVARHPHRRSIQRTRLPHLPPPELPLSRYVQDLPARRSQHLHHRS